MASISSRSDPQRLTYSRDLLTDPVTKQEREDLTWYLEEYCDWPYEQFLERSRQAEALLPEIGKRLYKTLLG